MASEERRLGDTFWDLRDDAYDHPERWEGVGAEEVFQRLAEFVEEAGQLVTPVDWGRFVTAPILDWRRPEG
jgi:hypothetical protein